jgi:hypothetical protein
MQQWHPEKADFVCTSLDVQQLSYQPMAGVLESSQLEDELGQLSTLLRPDIAGIDPSLLDPRDIAASLNRIRACTSFLGDANILRAMGLVDQRIEQVFKGGRFIKEEIEANLALVSFISR